VPAAIDLLNNEVDWRIRSQVSMTVDDLHMIRDVLAFSILDVGHKLSPS